MGGAHGAQGIANALNRGEQSYGSSGPVVKSATATLTPDERFVHVDTASTITMPEAGEVHPGDVYIVRVTATVNVTLEVPGGTENPNDFAFTAIGDQCTLVSDGQYWYEMSTIET